MQDLLDDSIYSHTCHLKNNMSALTDAFLSAYTKGVPLGERAAIFTGIFNNMVYDDIVKDIGYGSFQDGFLVLFSDETERYNECLKLWSFLLPADNVSRKVIGRNAYGALLVIEEAEKNGTAAVLGILDPVTVSYWRNEHCLFANFLGHWLPMKKVPGTFTDSSVYESWKKGSGKVPETGEILAIKVPLTLGGKMEPGNFQIENFASYFASTAAIYRKATGRS